MLLSMRHVELHTVHSNADIERAHASGLVEDDFVLADCAGCAGALHHHTPPIHASSEKAKQITQEDHTATKQKAGCCNKKNRENQYVYTARSSGIALAPLAAL